jgi:hypothetical protein
MQRMLFLLTVLFAVPHSLRAQQEPAPTPGVPSERDANPTTDEWGIRATHPTAEQYAAMEGGRVIVGMTYQQAIFAWGAGYFSCDGVDSTAPASGRCTWIAMAGGQFVPTRNSVVFAATGAGRTRIADVSRGSQVVAR